MLVSRSSRSGHAMLGSGGFVRLEMSTGTDWPRLDDLLVDVVDHLSELLPSHVQAPLEDW